MSRFRHAGAFVKRWRAFFGAVPLRATAILLFVFLLLTGILVWFNPAPPSTLRMAVGKGGGVNGDLARQYQTILARDGIRLELVKTDGSIDTLQQLADVRRKVDVGYVLGGVAHGSDMPGLVTLGSLYYDPIWIFYRARLGADLSLDALRGRRVAIGSPTSGAYINSIRILESYDLDDANTRFEMMNGREALRALQAGTLDAAFLTAPPESKLLRDFFADPALRLVSGRDNRALAARFPYLQLLQVPRGTVDLAGHWPADDVEVLATTMTLVAREDVHTALVYRLMSALREVNGKPNLLAGKGVFPSDRAVDFPISPVASRFYRSGEPFLQAYFPYWVASLIDRFLVIVLPVLMVMLPVVRLAPVVFSWTVRLRLSRWYARLLQLEAEIRRGTLTAPRALERLDLIERSVREIRLPMTYTIQIYVLVEHIDFVRRSIREGRWSGSDTPNPPNPPNRLLQPATEPT